MRHLQKLHEKYESKGLVLLGFNFSDDKEIAKKFLRENSAVFPTVLDASSEAQRIGFDGYKTTGVPLNYIIDKEGKVLDTWYGYEEGHKRALTALEKAGLEVDEP
ncbi:MAG: TlpA family protein disulfide reductase [Sedimentisphaerales bacterium]|nr:TlpA family protein disulfide reductase [Sedimentisphaerales bacterium]